LTVTVSRITLGGMKLDDLARLAGTSPRTVRYYVQRGLLPPPTFRGKDSAYGEDHLVRLRVIRTLQEAFLPLDAIASTIAAASATSLRRWSEGEDLPTFGRPSALPSPSKVKVTPYRRLALAEGLELHVADDAPAAARALVEKIVRLVEL